MITVEVAYANAEQQVIKTLHVNEGCSILEAIQISQILNEYPEINLAKNKVGVFGKLVPLSQIVKEGNRIEIYRSLTIDPKQARLLRAQKAKFKANNKLP